ncbi:hypothetical protein [Hugenholtzia roseola]|uniref:hypothetical protein n=1 Tax=Hugenholtzia roseola TaxID=1002 RepID=UPI000405BB46|nr:hypothetical protein [Hugenholtzia roseola]
MKFLKYTTFAFAILLSSFFFYACENKSAQNTETNTDSLAVDSTTNQMQPPTQFPNLEAMMTDIGDYATYQVKGQDQVEVTSNVPNSADAAYIEKTIKIDLLKVAYRTFIHTNLEKVTVTALVNATVEGKEKQEVRTLTFERNKALEALKTQLNLNDFKDLVGNKMGDLYRPDMQNANFENLIEAKLDAVYNDLQAK